MENINEENDNNNTDSNDDESVSDAVDQPLLSGEELLAESQKLTDEIQEPASADPEFDEPVADQPTFDQPASDAYAAPPPPQMTPPQTGGPVEDRLVRDPHAFFGGVLSGIAHRFGWDVSATRLVFIVLVFVSGGIAIPTYLLSWLIIPRARFWPPVVRQGARGFEGRDLGIALVALGALVVVAIGAGDAAAVIVPLVLVAGGMWLLFQSPRQAVASPVAAPMPDAGTFAFAPAAPGSAGAGDQWTEPQMPAFEPQPVDPPSRLRRGVILGVIVLFLLTPLLIIGGIIAAIASSDFDVNFDETTLVEPVGVGGIPTFVVGDSGEYVLDLSDTDLSPLLEDGADPLTVSIDMDAGRLEVIVPSDLEVEVDAEIDAIGDVRVFGNNEDGFGPRLSVVNDDADLILDLSIDFGEIEVVRAG